MDLHAQTAVTLPARLATARLVLRPVAAGDAAPVIAALGNLAVARWVRPVPHPYTAADFAEMRAASPPGEVWAIDDADGFAGIVGLAPRLGYWLAPDRHGRGYATEAAGAVLAAHRALRPGQPVDSYHFAGNAASARVLAKLGFVETGRGTVFARALGHDVAVRRVTLYPAAPAQA